MCFMDNFYLCLSQLLPDDDPEYRSLRVLEERILGDLRLAAGRELVERLADAQEERLTFEYRQFFLWGLRLGAELLDA